MPPTPQEVGSIIASALERITPPAELAFYGGSFTCLPPDTQREYLQAVRPFLNRGQLSGIRISTRPDAIDGEVLALLADFGVKTVELGAQSLDDRVLSLANRGHSAKAVENASALIKAAGFKLILQLMFGLPGDSAETARASCLRAASLNPDGVRFYPVVVLKGTRLYDMYARGEYAPLSPEAAAELCGALIPIFVEKQIPIIRLGLNPTDDLSQGTSVAAGAYHPALGEMAWSRYFFNMACEKLENRDVAGKTLILSVHPRRLSAMAGQHRANTNALKAKFSPRKIKILPADIDENSIMVSIE